MEHIKFKLTGTAPLMMHRDTFANPLNPLTKAHKELTGKRKKTDEDHELIALSEWRSSLYHDDVEGPYVPGIAVESMLVEAAKMQKLGKHFTRGVMVLEDICPLQYEGPRTIAGLQADSGFTDCRSVRVQLAKVMRYRPIFRNWSIIVTAAFNPEVVNADDVIKAMNDGGAMVGLLDYRPRFGRFSVEIVK